MLVLRRSFYIIFARVLEGLWRPLWCYAPKHSCREPYADPSERVVLASLPVRIRALEGCRIGRVFIRTGMCRGARSFANTDLQPCKMREHGESYDLKRGFDATLSSKATCRR